MWHSMACQLHEGLVLAATTTPHPWQHSASFKGDFTLHCTPVCCAVISTYVLGISNGIRAVCSAEPIGSFGSDTIKG
jgi:hypothetical protein